MHELQITQRRFATGADTAAAPVDHHDHIDLEAVRTIVDDSVLLVSERECEVLEGVAAGLSNIEIAEGCGISPQTVKAHVAHLLRKLGARNRAHLVTIGVARGMLRIRHR